MFCPASPSPSESQFQFFAKLSDLFAANRANGHGSIYLTQKRMVYNTDADTSMQGADDPLWDEHPEHPLPVIIRANTSKSKAFTPGTEKAGITRKDKKKVKVSTIVQPADLDSFFAKYAEACKAGMTALKKRDRSKRKKDKKKKKGGEGEKKG
jgi:signal recognition particle subunit SRP14